MVDTKTFFICRLTTFAALDHGGKTDKTNKKKGPQLSEWSDVDIAFCEHGTTLSRSHPGDIFILPVNWWHEVKMFLCLYLSLSLLSHNRYVCVYYNGQSED